MYIVSVLWALDEAIAIAVMHSYASAPDLFVSREAGDPGSRDGRLSTFRVVSETLNVLQESVVRCLALRVSVLMTQLCVDCSPSYAFNSPTVSVNADVTRHVTCDVIT